MAKKLADVKNYSSYDNISTKETESVTQNQKDNQDASYKKEKKNFNWHTRGNTLYFRPKNAEHFIDISGKGKHKGVGYR